MNRLDKNEHKSMDKLIETLNKELESQDGYDMYFK